MGGWVCLRVLGNRRRLAEPGRAISIVIVDFVAIAIVDFIALPLSLLFLVRALTILTSEGCPALVSDACSDHWPAAAPARRSVALRRPAAQRWSIARPFASSALKTRPSAHGAPVLHSLPLPSPAPSPPPSPSLPPSLPPLLLLCPALKQRAVTLRYRAPSYPSTSHAQPTRRTPTPTALHPIADGPSSAPLTRSPASLRP